MTDAVHWKPEPELLATLDDAVPEILASQHSNGRFGTDPWICQDQNVLLALAAAWSLPESRHYQREEVLDAIVRGGNALIDDMDDEGRWIFRKKDYSEWGMIRMPWTYSRWIRAYQIIREHVRDADRQRWDAALRLGYGQIAQHDVGRTHNIPAHHAMGLYCAGIVFDEPTWRSAARDLLHRVVDAQTSEGWWTEHCGPVVAYGMVYVEALGVYYSLTQSVGAPDDFVLDALDRAARFHAGWVYPDGSAVEVIDERNPYHTGVRLGNPGFSHTKIGRGFLLHQHKLMRASGEAFGADYEANMLLFAGSGAAEEIVAGSDTADGALGDNARVYRRRPWFVAMSAFTSEMTESRWIQDRQNFVSVFHDRCGLIAGGGNTKLQPLWSTFTVGDTSLLRHIPGDEEPNFFPPTGLRHVPDSGSVTLDNGVPVLTLNYGDVQCRVTAQVMEGESAILTYELLSESPEHVEAHVTFLPHLGERLSLSTGDSVELGEASVAWELGADGSLEHGSWRATLPKGTRIVWPVLPHNPYRKDGHAEIDEGRIVAILPLSADSPRAEIRLSVA